MSKSHAAAATKAERTNRANKRELARGRVQRFLARHPRLHVHFFLAYAPELNPAEYVWAQADGALANGAPDDLAELRHSLGAAVRRLRRSQGLLWSCIYASDLPWTR